MMKINKTITSGLMTAVALALVPHAASAWSPKLEVSDTTWVQLGYLHQFWYETVDNKTADGSRSNDFFTRRNRVMLLGQATEQVWFFMNYDAASAGVTGNQADLRQTPVLTDAMIDYRISTAFNVVVGRQLVPFSVDNQSSAASLNGIDYPTRALAPQPTTAGGAFWRDDGIAARGLLANGLIDYRVGFFRGDRGAGNPGGDGRMTGMVMINLASAQGGWFFNPNSLGALDVLSFGVGYDQMGRSAQDDHKAFSLFAIAEKNVGAGHISAQAAYYDWEGVGAPGGAFYNGGSTSNVAVSFLPTGSKWQPIIRWQNQDPDDGTKLDTIGIGLNYYISGHRANIKFEYSIDDQIIGGSKEDAFRIQSQLFF
jgi:hypothetical protein